MNENETLLQQLSKGQLPEVKFNVTLEKESIVRLSVAVVIISLIIILTAHLINKK